MKKILFVAGFIISVLNTGAQTLYYYKKGDTVIVDMGEPGQAGAVKNNDTIYVGAVNYQRDMIVRIGPVYDPAAIYGGSRPDHNVFSSWENPMTQSGDYHFTKKINNITYSATIWVIWPDSLKTTPFATGDSVCSNNKNFTVRLNAVKDATLYHWILSPSQAGTITKKDSSVTLTLNKTFTGTLEIRAVAEAPYYFNKISNPFSLYVLPSPESNFEVATGTDPYIMQFTNTSQHSDFYDLDFGDGSVHFTGNSFTTYTHNYVSKGMYTTTLITRKGQCYDTLSKAINVWTASATPVKGISVFPNPASDHLLISVDDLRPGMTFTITSADGKVISHQCIQNHSTSVDVSMLARGVYLLKIENVIFRVIKQ